MHPRLISQSSDARSSMIGKVDDVAGACSIEQVRDPRRPRRRRALHVEEVAGDAVRIALHHHRRGPRRAGSARRRSLQVVAQQIALGQPELGKVDLAQVGQRDAAPVDVDGRVVDVASESTAGMRSRLVRSATRAYTRKAGWRSWPWNHGPPAASVAEPFRISSVGRAADC